eukprot:CAMPEP_0174363850 /NCGR_PEP_ID=MMETSP0811_2-20130205/70507_1 /TAXON_ID=73025 ORGANISM="Eutreptiella gymnastica-like, Strain CCMP1594" /NCGR_SAMPLE_ID=MMETSP0811_2 /ASSEMBLY_ACC=CAM_ASM_000667 /LENGTH=79 /DNA_ID=CAMNT_0015502929 /DNA_START=132 /DNA_END=372 /DNA_ORIENTATION=-
MANATENMEKQLHDNTPSKCDNTSQATRAMAAGSIHLVTPVPVGAQGDITEIRGIGSGSHTSTQKTGERAVQAAGGGGA